MSRIFLVGLLACFLSPAFSQEVQWANKLLRHSSQYGNKSYSAEQVLGPPNALPQYGSSQVAWAPAKEDNNMIDYVWVEFENAIHVQQIVVAENLNPGAISKIFLFNERNRRKLVYEQEELGGFYGPGRMFSHTMERTDYKVKSLRLELNTAAVPGMNQIDAIGIADHKDPIKAQINLVDYFNYKGEPENLGRTVNSRFEDRLPIIAPDGRTLYFARKEQPDESGQYLSDDIFYSELGPNGQWMPAQDIGKPLNNEFHNYVAAVSTDGEELILANEYNRFGDEGVSVATRKKGKWSRPDALRIKSMYNENEFSCYHMGVDGDVILLAIEQDDTYGDMDIYVSFKEEGDKWTRPLNIGPQVNTAGIEGSAFLAADGMTIYFSSNGHPGYGKMDMFMSRRLDDTWTNWSKPVNLGPKINSPQNEYNYTIPAKGDYAYFSSSNGQFGGADLFRIQLPPEVRPKPVALLKGQFIDAITKKPLEVTLRYTKTDALRQEAPKEEQRKVKGKFGLVLPMEDDFEVVAEVPGYYPVKQSREKPPIDEDLYVDFDESDEQEAAKRNLKEAVYEEVTRQVTPEALPKMSPEELEQTIDRSLEAELRKKATPALDTEALKEEVSQDIQAQLEAAHNAPDYMEMTDDIEMVPLKEGQVIRIDNLYFRANKSFLLRESYEELDKVVSFLEQNPGIAVEIGGHTNGLPSHDFCNELSDARAKRVYDYFIEEGIPQSRLTWKGYGKTEPIADNSTLQGRKKNQRVELKIISIQ